MTAAVTFHPLRVGNIEKLTPESVAITFEVPDQLADKFSFLPGQHLTLRAEIDGEDTRRTYSICTDNRSGQLRVGIKRLPQGRFSNFANTQLSVGDVLEVGPPIGEFVLEVDDPAETDRSHYGAIVAGSGITPVLGMIASSLPSSSRCNWALIYGNQTAETVMFSQELCQLKDRYPTQLQILHIYSREETAIPLFHGRIGAEKLKQIFHTVDPAVMSGWYLCGPAEMVETAQAVLIENGVSLDRIHHELFFAGPPPAEVLAARAERDRLSGTGPVELAVVLDHRESTVWMHPEETVLEAALTVRPELPYSCRGGMCASCKARVVSGEVEMDKNYALTAQELERGFVLTCQSRPKTDQILVDFDQR